MKESIVLIHGYGFDQRIWAPVELAFDRFDVIYLSLPGFGDTAMDTPYSLASLSQHYWQEILDQDIAKVHLVGHSMGGYICMEMLAQQPDKVSSLCLVHSHVFADTEVKKKARTEAIEKIHDQGREAFANTMIPSFFKDTDDEKRLAAQLVARGIQYKDEAWIYGMLAMRDRRDHRDTLGRFTNPVLLLMGEKDHAVPVELAYSMAALCHQCKLCIYPESGHMGMYDHTAKMIGDLIEFYG